VLTRLRAGVFASATRMAPRQLRRFHSGDLLDRVQADIDSLDRVVLAVAVPAVVAAIVGVSGLAVLALIRLNIARDELRARLRAATGSRLPLVSRSAVMISGYLAVERDLGRVGPGADIETLAATLIGTAHLLAADADGPPPDAAAYARVLASVLAGTTP